MASKYDPLRDHLMKQTLGICRMSFTEIEGVLGCALPKSALRPQWWANTEAAPAAVQREAWRAAKYDAFLEQGLRRVRFQKVR